MANVVKNFFEFREIKNRIQSQFARILEDNSCREFFVVQVNEVYVVP
jgi:hypothetical protein